MENSFQRADVLRNVARYGLLIIGTAGFFTALILGADLKNGIEGIIENSPNALPWLVLLILVFCAWKLPACLPAGELAGGILLTLFGIFLVYFFNFSGPNFWWSTFALTCIIPILGLFFILSWYLRKGYNRF